MLRFKFARSAAFSALLLTAGAASALQIVPTYDSTISGNAAAKATLDALVASYNSHFTDNTTVNISFGAMSSGLGQSSTSFVSVPYPDYLSKLQARSSGAVDATALAGIAAHPFSGGSVNLSAANARTVGYNVGGGTDSTIGLNLGLCFTGHATPVSGKYDLYAVAAHELDEALGTVSGVNEFSSETVADLFRYNGSGTRSFTADTVQHAYLSLDGTTNLVEYNQFGHQPGDWGDWVRHASAPQVQDYAGTSGMLVSPGYNEFALLDAVGYTQAVPEPTTWAVLTLGLAAVVRRRRS